VIASSAINLKTTILGAQRFARAERVDDVRGAAERRDGAPRPA